MTVNFQDFTMVSGNDKTIEFIVTGDDGNPVDISAYTEITFIMDSVPPVSKSLGDGITITDGSAGKYEVKYDTADTSDNPGRVYNYCSNANSPIPLIQTVTTGLINIQQVC